MFSHSPFLKFSLWISRGLSCSSLTFFLSLTLSVLLYLSLPIVSSLSLSLSVWLYISLSIVPSLYLSLSYYIFLSLSFPCSLYHYVFLSFCSSFSLTQAASYFNCTPDFHRTQFLLSLTHRWSSPQSRSEESSLHFFIICIRNFFSSLESFRKKNHF